MEKTDFQVLDRLFREGKLKEAEQYLTTSMEQMLRDNDLPALLAVTNELGGIFRVRGKFEEAKRIYSVALEIIHKLGLEDTMQHGTTLLNLASVYTEMNEPGEALKLDEKAEAIFRSAGLEQDYRMAALYNNKSHALEKSGRLEEGLDLARRSLAIIKGTKGNDTELATSYTTLAIRCSKAGKYEEATSYLAEAERIFRSQPGKPDVHFAAALNSMGEVSYKTGKIQEAVGYFEEALRILKENYGENQAYQEVAKNLAKAKETAVAAIKGKPSAGAAWIEAPVHATRVPSSGRMTGLDLSEAYYNEYGKSLIEDGFAEYKQYLAVGLVGEGSDCLGFDDEQSESHDFGPGFCIWIPDHLDQTIVEKLKAAYEDLPRTFLGKRRMETAEGHGRVGVFRIRDFYRNYIGCKDVPATPVEWLFAPETSYATAVSGRVFVDHLGEFSRIRQGLLEFYPKDVLLKKLAARMAMMSQSGQYNYERSMKRSDAAAAYLSCSEFIKNTVSLIYLLNGRYMPFYKWMFRGMDQMKTLSEIKPMLERLAALQDLPENTEQKVKLMEDICIAVVAELRNRGIIQGTDPFLNSHCSYLMSQISDNKIRSLPVMFDAK